MVSAQVLREERAKVSAQVLHQATSPTSSHANWADGSFAELFAELYRDDLFAELCGSDHVAVSVSRPSNDRCRANRCEPNQNADALRSWSCKSLKLLMMMWSAPTSIQQSPRYAWGRSVSDQVQALLQPQLLMPQSQKPQDCGLFPVRKDNIRAYLTVISGIMMPPAGVDRAWDEAARKQGTPDGLPRSQQSSHHAPSGAWLLATMKAAGSRQ